MDVNYYVGLRFRLDEDYSNKAKYCNENNLMIEEIEGDQLGRLFEIKNVPEPSAQEIAMMKIQEKKQLLEKYKEDVEQVELFKMERTDYEEKKQICATLIYELRELEKEVNNV